MINNDLNFFVLAKITENIIIPINPNPIVAPPINPIYCYLKYTGKISSGINIGEANWPNEINNQYENANIKIAHSKFQFLKISLNVFQKVGANVTIDHLIKLRGRCIWLRFKDKKRNNVYS